MTAVELNRPLLTEVIFLTSVELYTVSLNGAFQEHSWLGVTILVPGEVIFAPISETAGPIFENLTALKRPRKFSKRSE